MGFFQLVVLLILALAALAILGSGQRYLQVGLVVSVLAMGLGYRSLYLTRALTLHPAELLIWGTFLLFLFQRSARDETPFRLPRWVVLLIPFWFFAWLPGLLAGRRWDFMLMEFKNFLVLIPLFVVAEVVLQDDRSWRSVILSFFAVGTWIAATGLLEYFLPSVAYAIPGFTAGQSAFSFEGFYRVAFSFYGSPVATFVLILTVPIAHVLVRWYPRQQALILLALLAQVVGVYIGGYRTMLLVLAAQITLWVLLSYGPLLGSVALFGLSLTAMWALPRVVQDRLYSVVQAVEGQATDSSAMVRMTRMSNAWEMTLRRPWGNGWSAAGWVHSDFVQVFANQGFLAGVLFAGAWLVTVLRLLTKVLTLREVNSKALGVSLLISMVGVGGVLMSQGVQVLVQLILPVWLIWALAEIWLRQAGGELQPESEEMEEVWG